MSRVGKLPIKILDGVNVNVSGNTIKVECSGKKLEYQVPELINVRIDNGEIIVERTDESVKARAFQGLVRALINNMVIGVKEGFKKNLEMVGRGKKAKVQGKKLILDIGFSHSYEFDIPDGIEIKVEKTVMEVAGIDKQKVGEVAAEIRDIQPPEPYKGAGIRYQNEVVKKKAGKSAVGGGFTGGGK
jgi:large subunit ribosomal protein L6